jgi:hypothetical protein
MKGREGGKEGGDEGGRPFTFTLLHGLYEELEEGEVTLEVLKGLGRVETEERGEGGREGRREGGREGGENSRKTGEVVEHE